MVSSNSSFSPFYENNIENLNLLNRTFEELVSERGDLNYHFSDESCLRVDYNTLFEKIKSKLFQMNITLDLNITDCPIIKKYREDFLELKKTICDIYLDYMKAETELNEAKEKYTTFCESIKNCIHFIYNTGTQVEQDIVIKELLEQKIETYYLKLNIDSLQEIYNEKFIEFEKTKYKVSTITGTILPTTICQICLENQVDYFIDPCGHTICKTCKTVCENKSLSCHYCRTIKKGYKRIYL